MVQPSPAAERNRGPILEVLRTTLPAKGVVLEIASGSGVHAVHFARELTPLVFQPSDADPEALETIRSRRDEAGLFNLAAPVALDVTSDAWPLTHADAVLCINMLHIAPWSAAEGLFRGAARVLPGGAPLVTYGPYRFGGSFTAPSNADFDASLRSRNPAWGVRDADELAALAAEHHLDLELTVARPANNHVLVFRRR